MWSHFPHKELLYNLRKRFILTLPRINSTYYSVNTVYFKITLISNNLTAIITSVSHWVNLKKQKSPGNIDYGYLVCK